MRSGEPTRHASRWKSNPDGEVPSGLAKFDGPFRPGGRSPNVCACATISARGSLFTKPLSPRKHLQQYHAIDRNL